MSMSYRNKWITPGIKISSKNAFLNTLKKYYFKGSTGLYKTMSTYVQKMLKEAKKTRLIGMSKRQKKKKHCGT